MAGLLRRRGCTLDVRGDDEECALLVNGAPVALQWSDGERCGGMFLVRSGDTTALDDALRPLQALTDGGLDPALGLASQLSLLTNMFGDGRYELSLVPGVPVREVVEYDARFSFTEDRDHFHPGEHTLVATRSDERIDAARVQHYVRAIRKGERPLAITIGVSGARTSFLLDGHHKIKAYRAVGLPAAMLVIERTDTAAIERAEGLRLMGVCRRWVGEYLAAREERGE